MGDKIPLNAVKLVTDESGKVLGVEDLENGQSIPIEQVSDESKFVCEEAPFAPYDAKVGGSRWGSIGDVIGRLADGIKEAVEPVVEGAIGIFEGAKEFCATIIQKVKEEAVAQNMKKGVEDCAIKKEQSANEETGKKSDAIANEGSACATPDGGDDPQQAMIKNDGEDLSRNEVDENGPAGKEAIHTGALIAEVEVSVSKREEASTRTAMVLPNSAAAKDRSVADVGDKKIEQAEREEARKLEEKTAHEAVNANALQEKADNDKARAKGMRDNGLTERDEGPDLDINLALAQDERTRDTIMAEAFGETWAPFDPSPFASNDTIPVANSFNPLASVGPRVEELFPAIVQNLIGCFAYLQLQRSAHEGNANPFSHTQVMTGERGEKVWPAGKKEGGDNHSDRGNSNGRDKREEEPENNFPESA